MIKYQETSRMPGGLSSELECCSLISKFEICLWDLRETVDWL